MKNVYPSSSFLFPNSCQNESKIWGFVITAPVHREAQVLIPELNQCKKCRSYLIPQTSKCPICGPEDFYSKSDQFITQDLAVGSFGVGKKSVIICLAFDLSISPNILNQIIYTLLSPEFKAKNIDNKFIIVFLDQYPIFASIVNDSLQLIFNVFPDSNTKSIFTVDHMQSILHDAYQTLKDLVWKLDAIPNSTGKLFGLLNSAPLNHLVIFHSVPLELTAQTRLSYCVHSIEATHYDDSVLNSEHDFSSSDPRISRCMINRCLPILIQYISEMTDKNLPRKCNLSLTVSSGLDFKWHSDFVSEPTIQANRAELELENYSVDSIYSFTFSPNNKYYYAKAFTIQVAETFDGITYISTRVYPKASSYEDWLQSIQLIPMATIFFKQYLSTNSIRRFLHKKYRYTWNIIGVVDSTTSGLLLKKALMLFSAFCIDEPSILPARIRRELIFYIMNRGMTYFGDLISALGNMSADSDVIQISPFFIVSLSNESKVSIAGDVGKSYCGLVPIVVSLDDFVFSQIIAEINRILDKLEKLEM